MDETEEDDGVIGVEEEFAVVGLDSDPVVEVGGIFAADDLEVLLVEGHVLFDLMSVLLVVEDSFRGDYKITFFPLPGKTAAVTPILVSAS
jgi:hypothetical protein